MRIHLDDPRRYKYAQTARCQLSGRFVGIQPATKTAEESSEGGVARPMAECGPAKAGESGEPALARA